MLICVSLFLAAGCAGLGLLFLVVLLVDLSLFNFGLGREAEQTLYGYLSLLIGVLMLVLLLDVVLFLATARLSEETPRDLATA